MSTSVQRVIESFDALSDRDKHEAAVEILRRVPLITGDVPDSALVAAAEELFLNLDREEEDAKR